MHPLQNLIVDDNTAYDPQLGTSYKINPVTKEILQYLKEGLDKAAIVEKLHRRYKVPYDELYIDVSDVITKMKIYGLLS